MNNADHALIASHRLFELKRFFYFQCEYDYFWKSSLKQDPFRHMIVVNVFENDLVFLNINENRLWVFTYPSRQIHTWSLSVLVPSSNIKTPSITKLNKQRLQFLINGWNRFPPKVPDRVLIFLGQDGNKLVFYKCPFGIDIIDGDDALLRVCEFKENSRHIYTNEFIPIPKRARG